jgi:hypothetical protein
MAVIRRPGKVKLLAAAVGGGATLTLGVLGAVSGGSEPTHPLVLSVGELTMGGTATAAYSATIATSLAVPTDKATPPCGFGTSC